MEERQAVFVKCGVVPRRRFPEATRNLSANRVRLPRPPIPPNLWDETVRRMREGDAMGFGNGRCETGALVDVRDFAADRIFEMAQWFDGEDIPVDELGWEIVSEINVDGSVTFSREEALEWLERYPETAESALAYMIGMGIADYEDVYLGDHDGSGEPSSDEYVRYEAERIQVIAYIALVQEMLASCPFYAEAVESGGHVAFDDAKADEIIDQLNALDLSEIELEAY